MESNGLGHVLGLLRRLHVAAKNGHATNLSGLGPDEVAVLLEKLHTSILTWWVEDEPLQQQKQDLHEARQELLQMRERFHELFEFTPDGFLITDAHGIIHNANLGAAHLLGTRKEFLLGKPFPLFLAEGLQTFYQTFARLIRGQEMTRQWQVVLRPVRGEPLPVALHAAAIRPLADGGPAEFRWLLRDISEWKRAERNLLEEKSFGDNLAEVAQAIILAVDPQGRITRANPYLRTVSGFTEKELLGQEWAGLLLPETEREGGRKLIQAALASPRPKAFLCPLVTRHGNQRIIAWSARVRGPGLEKSMILVLGSDVTEMEEKQRQTMRAERLAAIGQMVAGLAHESRNALQRIQACLELLRMETRDQPRALGLLDRLQESQDSLHRLYEDVRQYAAPIRLDTCFCNLARKWREAWDCLVPLREGRDAQLREEMNGIDLECNVDRFRMIQVFRNVLENALAACADPVRIVIACSEATLDGQPAVRVMVRDNGPGLTGEQRKKVFEPFYTTKTRGTGLGLSITQRLVEAHGGTIAVGAGDPGAEFIITLPRRKP